MEMKQALTSLAASLLLANPLLAQTPTAPPIRDLYPDTWTATDGLGRLVSVGGPTGALRPNKTVGMFYFLANHVTNTPVYDITKLLAEDSANPKYGPVDWWGQPWFGYYQSNDESVIRKHMQMLANAGVDVLVFDNTNGPTYPDVYLPLCKVLEEMRAEGDKAPQIAFFTGHNAWNTLYKDLYSKNFYADLWFRWKGKPLMMVHLDGDDKLPAQINEFFNVRISWAWTPGGWFGDGHDKWPWLDNYPQNFGWHEDAKTPEQISVVVAQHATTSIGRSFTAKGEPPVDDLRLTPETPNGVYFKLQFERALKVNPEFIFITGWNEWTAGKYTQDADGRLAGKPNPKGAPIFVDEYNEEFSRDIEPEQGRLRDNYYYQFVDFMRRYKGARPVPPVTRRQISLTGGFEQWNAVAPEYRDAVGDPVHRDSPGWGELHYTNTTGRNDIVTSKVCYDDTNVYFYVRAEDAITAPTGDNWMLLFLNTDADAKTGWLGYDFVVNRKVGTSLALIERNVGGMYKWQAVGAVKFTRRGNDLMLAVPRKLLDLKPGNTAIDFKWADNCISASPNVSDFTLNGDAAPDDRFNYRAVIGR